jgi:hypothetical protein
VLFADGTTLMEPERRLADKVGSQTEAKAPFHDVVVVALLPPGLRPAYGGAEGLRRR